MELENVYIHRKHNGELNAIATINVPGIGAIKIESSLSAELCSMIREEAIASLRTRLGQTLGTPNVELTGAAPLYGAASSDRRERG